MSAVLEPQAAEVEVIDRAEIKDGHALVEQRFFAKVLRAESGCWLWRGSLDAKGYGRLHVNGRPKGAHRVSYELHVGEIAPGLFVCHRCDNPACVNPGHLFVGTNQDNVDDCRAKGRLNNKAKGRAGSANSRAKLSTAHVTMIRSAPKTESSASIARSLGVSASTVERVRSGVRWNSTTIARSPT